MANVATQTLKSIPFEHLIGGPMKAAIEAQAIAAKSTVDFITAVGFKPQEEDPFFPATIDGKKPDPNLGEIQNVTFQYKSTGEGSEENVELTVPMLTIVPIPYIRIDEMTIDFTAKITEVQQHQAKTTASSQAGVSSSVGYRSWWSPVSASFKASYSSTHTSSNASQSRYQTEYTMNVHVRAVQDDMPGGLAKVLQILENAILEKRKDPAALPSSE